MNILQECTGAQTIGIGGHVRPDGDCVGSCLALYQYFKKCLPQASVKVFLEKPAEIFSSLAGYDEIDSECSVPGCDVFFCLDCAEDRLGRAQECFQQSERRINIDHHISNSGCGDVNYIKPEVGSTSELIYDLLDREAIDREIAMALYVGIIHDTGVFQYSNTTPQTLTKAAHLISFGFDFSRLIEETFYEKTYKQAQLMGRALMESIRFMHGECIVSYVTRKQMEFYHAEPADLEGIVNQLRNIKGISCAVFLYETDVLEYKISMRSDEKVDVAMVASYFGGGGHKRAAGCTMKGTVHDCINNLSLHIEKQLKEQEQKDA